MMNAMLNQNELLEDFDLIDQFYAKAGERPWFTPQLNKILVVMRDGIYIELDETTRPRRKNLGEILAEKRAAGLSHPQAIPRETPKIGFEYKGEFIPCTSCLDIHRKLLRQLWADCPEKRETIADSVKRLGYNRSYISNDQAKLFHYKKDPNWVKKYSNPLMDGWYIDINVNPERIKRILPKAVRAAGLTWETDVCVFWA